MNPHSRDLFTGNIRQLYGNAADVVPTLPDGSFDRIIHDPPTFALAGRDGRSRWLQTLLVTS